MERRMYLHAAWLFLLARVVHRALIRDEEVENSWHACGIIVSVCPFELLSGHSPRPHVTGATAIGTAAMGYRLAVPFSGHT